MELAVQVGCDGVGVKFGLSVSLGVALAMALVMQGFVMLWSRSWHG